MKKYDGIVLAIWRCHSDNLTITVPVEHMWQDPATANKEQKHPSEHSATV